MNVLANGMCAPKFPICSVFEVKQGHNFFDAFGQMLAEMLVVMKSSEG